MFNAAGHLQIDYLSGRSRYFAKLGDKYRLVKVIDNNQNQMVLQYHNNLLSKVIGDNHRFVAIERNDAGRIIKVTDDQQRAVTYQYNSQGLLVAVSDLGEHLWRYKYKGNRLLHKIIDPNNQSAGVFKYGKDDRVSAVKVRSVEHQFLYSNKTTIVKNADEKIVTFGQNDAGRTTAVTDDSGSVSRITLNENNQVVELWQDEIRQAQIIYDDNARPARYDISGKPTQVQNGVNQYAYQYDQHGRLKAVSGNGVNSSYVYDAKGNLLEKNTAKLSRAYTYDKNGDVLSETERFAGIKSPTTTYQYNNDGLVTSMVQSNQISAFEYNAVGKLSKVIFPDGASHSYQYNKLGFRILTQRSDKTAVEYNYDAVGNLIGTIKLGSNGLETGRQNQVLNSDNQLTQSNASGATPMQVKYSQSGNPVQITQGDWQATYQYDRFDRLLAVDESKTGQASYRYQQNEDDIRLQLDTRTKPVKSQQSKVTANNQSQNQLLYARAHGTPWQAVIWSSALSKLLVPSPEQISAPDDGFQSSKQRRRLYDAKSKIKAHQHNFDKPSNISTRPTEYFEANCTSDTGGPGDLNDSGGIGSDCFLYGVILDAASTITVGNPYSFSAYSVADDKCVTTNYNFSIDNVVVGQSQSGYFPYTFSQPGQHSVEVSAECSCGGYFKWDGMTINAQCPANSITTLAGSCVTSVGLNAPSKLTLLDEYTFTVAIVPSTVAIDNYQFEIRREKGDAAVWHTLYSGPTSSYSDYAKVAGHFLIRVRLTSNDQEYLSPARKLEVQFPTFANIISSSDVRARTGEVWDDILAETNVDWRREKGLWIFLNTATKKYEFGPIINGPKVGHLTGADIAMTSPHDIPGEKLFDPMTYVVASFHGHTPTFYRPVDRRVGASDKDKKADFATGITGIVLDYIAVSGGLIPAGHPLGSPANWYHVPESMRITPE